jgi:hypothetical protein
MDIVSLDKVSRGLIIPGICMEMTLGTWQKYGKHSNTFGPGIEIARYICCRDTMSVCLRDNKSPGYYVHGILSPRNTISRDIKGRDTLSSDTMPTGTLCPRILRHRDTMSGDTTTPGYYVRGYYDTGILCPGISRRGHLVLESNGSQASLEHGIRITPSSARILMGSSTKAGLDQEHYLLPIPIGSRQTRILD